MVVAVVAAVTITHGTMLTLTRYRRSSSIVAVMMAMMAVAIVVIVIGGGGGDGIRVGHAVDDATARGLRQLLLLPLSVIDRQRMRGTRVLRLTIGVMMMVGVDNDSDSDSDGGLVVL